MIVSIERNNTATVIFVITYQTNKQRCSVSFSQKQQQQHNMTNFHYFRSQQKQQQQQQKGKKLDHADASNEISLSEHMRPAAAVVQNRRDRERRLPCATKEERGRKREREREEERGRCVKVW